MKVALVGDGCLVDHVVGAHLCSPLFAALCDARCAARYGKVMPSPDPQLRHMTSSTPTFLEALAAPERDALLAAGHRRGWAAGEVLFREGDTAGSALVIVSGLVKIGKRGQGGDELILSLCGPGDLLGEVTAVQGATRSADVVALQDVEAMVVAVADLRGLLTRYPPIALVLLELALRRLRLADQRRLEFASAESLPRVTSRLLELAERFGVGAPDGALVVDMPISQEELASWAAASRESTARALRTLRELGLIETRRKRMVVLDADGLRQHASRL
jgi:CRP/FNR family cyclic AMP-dependent transcriptional regulator